MDPATLQILDEAENSKLKLAKLHLKIGLLSHPDRVEVVGKYIPESLSSA